VWILIQLVSSVGSIAQTAQGGGVVYLAHVGGFVVGLVLVRFFASGGRSQTAWA
jgi:rhomboid family protein